jgi:hypothetical protein
MNTRTSWFLVLAAMAGGGLLGMLIQGSLGLPSGSRARADEPQPLTSASGPAVPEYVTKAEVTRVCKGLGLRDWTEFAQTKVTPEEARKILAVVKPPGLTVVLEDFQSGLEVELEHGLKFREANVTNNHPILTGRIVVAHLLEVNDYYQRLRVVELEADLLKTLQAGNAEQARAVYRELITARIALNRGEAAQLGSK